MKNQNKNYTNANVNTNKKTGDETAEVLYQRLGNDWYAFAEVNGEFYMSKVDKEVIVARKEEQVNFFLNAISDETPSQPQTAKNSKAA